MNRPLLFSFTLGITLFMLNLPASYADIPVNQNYFQNPAYATTRTVMPAVDLTNPNNNMPGNSPYNAPVVTQPPIEQPVIEPMREPVQRPVSSSDNTNVMLQSHPAEAQMTNGFHITFQTPFTSNNAQDGDAFIATAGEDLWVQNQLLIPKGSVIRGRIVTANKKGIFGSGGELTLDFDHVVMPDGTLKSVNYQMTPTQTNARTNQFSQSYEAGRLAAQSQTERGVQYAKSKGGGINYLLAVPTNALLGVASGTLITTRGVTKAIFGKADAVVVNPGDEYVIQYNEATRIFR